MASLRTRENGKVQVRWRDLNGKDQSKTFGPDEKRRAKAFRADVENKLNQGFDVDMTKAKITFQQWSDQWKQGQRMHRASTYRQAETDLKQLNKAFGDRLLRTITVSEVKSWVAAMKSQNLKPSTIYARHRRLKQVMDAAVDEGVLHRHPVGRKTSPPMPPKTVLIPTTEQVWELYDAVPSGLKPAVLLGAFAGLRGGEAVAVEPTNVDFMRGVIELKRQHSGELKTESSKWPVPIADEVALELSKYVGRGFSDTLVQSAYGEMISPNRLQVHVSRHAEALGLHEGFRFHDLRHYYASALIDAGLTVIQVQHCMRHAKASTTLNTYGHLWPDTEEAPRSAVSKLFAGRETSKSGSNVA